MALFFADLVREFSSSAGAGEFVLDGAVPGHRRFAGVVPGGARFHYAIAGVTRTDQWEVGVGEIGGGGALLRSPTQSSAGGAAVAFAEGLKTVALTVGADWFAAQEAGVGIGDVAGLEAALGGKAGADHHHDGRYQLLDAAPAPFLRAVMQHPVLGNGIAQAVPAMAFTTIAVAQAEDNAGAFSDATRVYTVPEAGLYDCELKVKAVDGAAPGGSYGIGIDTANRDSAAFAWGQLNTSRNGIQNRVMQRFAAGDAVRGFIYSDAAIGLNGAELIVRKVG